MVEGEGGLGPSGGLQGQGAVGPKVPLAGLHEAQKGQAFRLQGAFLGGEEEGLRLPVLPHLQEGEGLGQGVGHESILDHRPAPVRES